MHNETTDTHDTRTMTLRRSRTTIALTIALAALVSCDGSTPPEGSGVPTSELRFIRPAAGTPALAQNEVSFWAKKGEDAEGRLYRPPGTGEDDDFVRLRVRRESLLRRPDGTPFANGDSVLITLRLIDAANLLVEMSPSGLTFSPSRPAELKFEFDEADRDFNRDGVVNALDLTVASTLQIWKREAANLPWVPLVSQVEVEFDEIEAELLGFTTYAVAYRSRSIQ